MNNDVKTIRRSIANKNERRRMKSINNGFKSLKKILRFPEHEKISKAALLQLTVDYVKVLQKDKSSLEEDNLELRRTLEVLLTTSEHSGLNGEDRVSMAIENSLPKDSGIPISAWKGCKVENYPTADICTLKRRRRDPESSSDEGISMTLDDLSVDQPLRSLSSVHRELMAERELRLSLEKSIQESREQLLTRCRQGGIYPKTKMMKLDVEERAPSPKQCLQSSDSTEVPRILISQSHPYPPMSSDNQEESSYPMDVPRHKALDHMGLPSQYLPSNAAPFIQIPTSPCPTSLTTASECITENTLPPDGVSQPSNSVVQTRSLQSLLMAANFLEKNHVANSKKSETRVVELEKTESRPRCISEPMPSSTCCRPTESLRSQKRSFSGSMETVPRCYPDLNLSPAYTEARLSASSTLDLSSIAQFTTLAPSRLESRDRFSFEEGVAWRRRGVTASVNHSQSCMPIKL